jgi:hypothetical protein
MCALGTALPVSPYHIFSNHTFGSIMKSVRFFCSPYHSAILWWLSQWPRAHMNFRPNTYIIPFCFQMELRRSHRVLHSPVKISTLRSDDSLLLWAYIHPLSQHYLPFNILVTLEPSKFSSQSPNVVLLYSSSKNTKHAAPEHVCLDVALLRALHSTRMNFKWENV